MHGELMEFNELLQKQLLCRESQLRHLTEELVSLRGPVSTRYLCISRVSVISSMWILIFYYRPWAFCAFVENGSIR